MEQVGGRKLNVHIPGRSFTEISSTILSSFSIVLLVCSLSIAILANRDSSTVRSIVGEATTDFASGMMADLGFSILPVIGHCELYTIIFN